MSFLVPLFLLGLAGIVIPIVVHLTRKQRRQVVAFPSLMFLQKVPFQEQRRRRIQHWLLLSLRALALALLAVAFARPFLDDASATGAGGGGPRELVVLVDQSYSMSAGDQWERAVQAARDELATLGPLDRASLVLFSQGARVVLRSTSDAARLTSALDTVVVGSGTTRYGPALKVAQTILEESELPRGEVVLVSDFQRSGWTGDEGVRLPQGTVVRSVPIQSEIIENVQVSDVRLVRQAAGGRERVTPTVRIARQGGTAPVDVPVALELDGQEIQSRSVQVAPDGSATVTFAPFTLSELHTRGTVRVPTDDVDADDARHFVLSPGSAISVLIADGAATRGDASFYLTRALGTSEEGRFQVRVRRGDGVRSDELAGTDLVILNDARIDGPSAEVLRAFTEAGGGVLVVLGDAAAWPASAADFLPGTPGPVTDRADGRGGRLGFLEYGHPVFEVFAGPRSGDFSGARFFRARAFAAADSASIVARYDDGSVAIAETPRGQGRVMVWTSTLDAFWNDLALQPVYLPFTHRLAEYLSGRADALPWLIVGQVVDLADPKALQTAGLASMEAAAIAAGSDQVALTPAGTTVAVPAAAGPRYLPMEERGFYTLRPLETSSERPIVMAVNVDLSESSLTRMDPEELMAQVRAGEAAAAPGDQAFEAVELARQDQERRQSLWRFVLLAAFTLLIAETALSNWVSRGRSGTPGLATG